MSHLSSSSPRGRAGHRRRRRAWLSLLAVAGVLALGVPSASAAAVRAGGSPPAPATAAAGKYYSTTLSYAIRFYPRFYTWFLQQLAVTTRNVNSFISPITGANGLIGPPPATYPGPNVDTVYAFGADLDLRQGPVILTIPPTKSRFSFAYEDVWGDNYDPIPPGQPGTYGLALPGWHGKLPPGVTRVNVLFPVTSLWLRADRYSNGVNMVASSKAFIAGLRLAPLPAYKADPSSGAPKFVPQAFFSVSAKVLNDLSMRYTPTLYLQRLQTAMHSPTTRPLSASDVALSKSFDDVFAAAQRALRSGNPVPITQMARAVRDTYATVVHHFMTHTVGNSSWIFFDNLGEFGTDYLARDGIAEFATGSNKPSAATYYFAYADARGARLNARTSYRLTFSKAQIPDAKRFWSVTAYSPLSAVRLIQWPGVRPIPATAKNVAAYTPGLVTNPNGSITIYIQPKPPANPKLYPNWLPVPAHGQFALWLRVYGPTGNTALDKHYVPSPILPAG